MRFDWISFEMDPNSKIFSIASNERKFKVKKEVSRRERKGEIKEREK